MKSKILDGLFQFLIITLLIALISLAGQLKAQELHPIQYKGLEGTIGHKSFQLISDIDAISNLNFQQDGGSIGIVFGNRITQINLRGLGLFYSSQKSRRTIDLLEFGINTHFYIINALSDRPRPFDIYAIIGINYQYYKFFGHYLKEPVVRPSKNGKEPLLGRVNQINFNTGFGLEYRLMSDISFVNLFLEYKANMAIQYRSKDAAFSNTYSQNVTAFNIGVRFGGLK